MFCDKSSMERGDFKQLAFVRNRGQIRYYVPRESLPEDVISSIEKTASQCSYETVAAIRKDCEEPRGFGYWLEEVSYSRLHYVLQADNHDDRIEGLIKAICEPGNGETVVAVA